MPAVYGIAAPGLVKDLWCVCVCVCVCVCIWVVRACCLLVRAFAVSIGVD